MQYGTGLTRCHGESRKDPADSGSKCTTCEGRIRGDDGFVEEVLSKVNERDHRPPAIPAVIEAVCTLYGLTPAALRAPGKGRPVAQAADNPEFAAPYDALQWVV